MKTPMYDRLSGGCRVLGLCVLLLLWPSVQAQTQTKAKTLEPAGFVLDIPAGEWFLSEDGKPPQKIKRGQALPFGAKLRAQSPSATITIILRDGEKIDCLGSQSKECRLPSAVKSTSHAKDALQGVIVAVMNLFSSQPTRYASTISRGNRLQDAVVRLANDKIDLSPVFENTSKDEYLLRFRPITRDRTTTRSGSLTRVPFSWDPDHASPATIRGIQPGLYGVSVWDPHLGEEESTPDEAWILVCGPSEYEKTAASWQQAVELTRTWGNDVRPLSVRGFLRAYLEALAEQGNK